MTNGPQIGSLDPSFNLDDVCFICPARAKGMILVGRGPDHRPVAIQILNINHDAADSFREMLLLLLR